MSKIYKLKNNRDFQRIYRRGQYAVSKSLAVYVQPNSLGKNRIGITVSKKYGKSVKRNRIRRLIRESWHLLQDKLKSGYDFVVVARRKEDNEYPVLRQIHKEMLYLMKKLNVLNKELL
ncbi:MAG: ribonuclease P protein component [Clostridiaceae bacterium]|nr:ribonuclease P protein component [Clostridiaceae bacterium]